MLASPAGAGKTTGGDPASSAPTSYSIRIQPREDGLYVDQIVLSPQQFLTAAPGLNKNDTTVLAR
jgi:hypothetical protein